MLDNSSTLLLARQDPIRRGPSKNIPHEIFSQQVEKGAREVSQNTHTQKREGTKENRATGRHGHIRAAAAPRKWAPN